MPPKLAHTAGNRCLPATTSAATRFLRSQYQLSFDQGVGVVPLRR